MCAKSAVGSGAATARSREPLGPNDLATLAVLGIVNEGFRSYADVVAAARSIATADWQPTNDLVASAVNRALEDGHLRRDRRAAKAAVPRWTISGTGRVRLGELLRRPAACCRSPHGRAATALKICFLGALDRETGCAVLEDLSHLHRAELRRLREGCASCPATRPYARRWMDREIERVEQEIGWLERLQADLPADTQGT